MRTFNPINSVFALFAPKINGKDMQTNVNIYFKLREFSTDEQDKIRKKIQNTIPKNEYVQGYIIVLDQIQYLVQSIVLNCNSKTKEIFLTQINSRTLIGDKGS